MQRTAIYTGVGNHDVPPVMYTYRDTCARLEEHHSLAAYLSALVSGSCREADKA